MCIPPLHTHVSRARACLTWVIVWPLWERGRHWAGSRECGRLCGNPDKCETEAEKTLLDLGLGVQAGFSQGPRKGSSLFPDTEGWPWGSSAALGPSSGLLGTVTRIRAAAPRHMQGRAMAASRVQQPAWPCPCPQPPVTPGGLEACRLSSCPGPAKEAGLRAGPEADQGSEVRLGFWEEGAWPVTPPRLGHSSSQSWGVERG